MPYARNAAGMVECCMRFWPATACRPPLSVDAVSAVPLVQLVVNVVVAVTLATPDGSMVLKLSVAGAAMTLHTARIFALTVRVVVPPANALGDATSPAATIAEARAVNLMLFFA